MATLTAYICNTRLPIGDITSDYNAISVTDKLVTAKITTVECINTENLIRIPVIQDSTMASTELFFSCISELIGEPVFNWVRNSNKAEQGDFLNLDTFIRIEGNDTDLVCFWEKTWVYGLKIDPDEENMLAIRFPSVGTGEIPENKSDVCPLETNFILENSQTLFVPGELLQLKWALKINGSSYQYSMAGMHFATPTITGGEILTVPSVNETREYDIKTQGFELSCKPTDFAEYVSGDWTFLLKENGSEAKKCDREADYSNEDAELEGKEVLRLVPLTVNSVGNASGSFETLDYNMLSSSAFAEFYEMSLHKAEIQSIDRYNKVASIKFIESPLTDLVVSGVSFFYHCEGESTIDLGHLAFRKNEEILVLNEGGGSSPSATDLKIVGFPERPHGCLSGILIISSPSEGESFAWDTIHNELLLEKDTHANIAAHLGIGVDAQLIPDGQYSQSDYPWDYDVVNDGSYALVTPIESSYVQGQAEIWIQHQDTLQTLLNIDALAFGDHGDPDPNGSDWNGYRKYWQQGDTIVLSTTEGSSNITLDSTTKTDENASFDVNRCWVDAGSSITQTWTITIYSQPGDPVPDYDADNYPQGTRWCYITGDTLGAAEVENAQYKDVDGSHYPCTSAEVSAGGLAQDLDDAGFTYNTERGNYFVKDATTLAPTLYHYKAAGSSYVPFTKDTFELLTGLSVGAEEYVDPRTRLYYFPLFSWPFDDSSNALVPFQPRFERLENTTLDIIPLLDSWFDFNFSALHSFSTDGVFNITTGIKESTNHTSVYDAYSFYLNGTQDNTVLHIFHKIEAGASGFLSPLEKGIFDGINAERSDASLNSLALQLNLQWAAQQHLDDMLSNYEYFKTVIGTEEAHTGTDNSSVSDRCYTDNGYVDFYNYKLSGLVYTQDGNPAWTIVGENISYNEDPEVTAQNFVDSWMASQTHKDVLLTEDYVDTGIAVGVAEDGTTFACQTFGACGIRWPGYSPLPYSGIQQYMNNNFLWNGTGDDSRLPKIYLT